MDGIGVRWTKAITEALHFVGEKKKWPVSPLKVPNAPVA